MDGQPAYLMNGVVVTNDGRTAYFTSSSSHFGLTDAMYELLSAGSGRLLQYDLEGGAVTVLVSGLAFPNGVALSADESSLLVAETMRYRVLEHKLVGHEAGQTRALSELPGMPDNVVSNGRGGYLVGLFSPLGPEDEAMVVKRVQAFPSLARLLAR